MKITFPSLEQIAMLPDLLRKAPAADVLAMAALVIERQAIEVQKLREPVYTQIAKERKGGR